MAISVPSEPKVHTTVYDNFRGVDKTNDPSNVWKKRSPGGVNMLPNLDGRPYKRNGWKIEFTSEDFCEAAGISPTTVEQYKVDYFELGGEDWLALYTSIGLFFYSDTLMYMDTYVPWIRPYRTLTATYAVGDICYRWTEDGLATKTFYECSTAITVPEAFTIGHWTQLLNDSNITESFPPSGDAGIDYTKSFFFEGGGDAGYYLFVGMTMFMFDGSDLKEVEPKIPLLLYGCSPSGVGEINESVNMLTRYRSIQYMGDGSTKTFEVPSGYTREEISGTYYATSILNVYLMNGVTGEWEVTDDWTAQPNNGAITFTNAPAAATEDNVRITYIPIGSNETTEQIELPTKSVDVYKETHHTQRQSLHNGNWVDVGEESVTVSYSALTSLWYSLVNPRSPVETYVRADVYAEGEWKNDNENLAKNFVSYGNSVNVIPRSANLWKAYDADIKTTTTESYSSVINGNQRMHYTIVKERKTFNVRVVYTSIQYNAADNPGTSAFFATSRALVFGNGIINQVFLTASSYENYSSRVWYSAATDPTYFPDTNYIEVGATDKKIMGLIRVGEYLGIVKQGSGKETSIYLAYATSFEDITTYAVKQSVNGVGAVSNGAFNILNDEPLFLSPEGVMGIEPGEDDERKIRNRSYYVNKPLVAEPGIETAFSFVYDGMYWLGINNHCYVLDGAQKTSWENTKTNLQYEAYYLENVPAKCFAIKDGHLWFIDNKGNLCRFRDEDPIYVDDYTVDDVSLYSLSAPVGMQVSADAIVMSNEEQTESAEWTNALQTEFISGKTIDAEGHLWKPGTVTNIEFSVSINGKQFYDGNVAFTDTSSGVAITANQAYFIGIDTVQVGDEATYTITFTYYTEHDTVLNEVITYDGGYYTVTGIEENVATLSNGVPIHATWSTIADDDGAANYYKKLQKKGSLVALLPSTSSGVKVYVKPDEKDAIFVGETSQGEHILPFNYYMRKKVKKYKRLQIICENDSYNDSFGVDEIIKCYTVGSYAKK